MDYFSSFLESFWSGVDFAFSLLRNSLYVAVPIVCCGFVIWFFFSLLATIFTELSYRRYWRKHRRKVYGLKDSDESS